MHWQEACAASKLESAVRENRDMRFTRFYDGYALVYSKRTGHIREAFPRDVEGYLDWEPEV